MTEKDKRSKTEKKWVKEREQPAKAVAPGSRGWGGRWLQLGSVELQVWKRKCRNEPRAHFQVAAGFSGLN